MRELNLQEIEIITGSGCDTGPGKTPASEGATRPVGPTPDNQFYEFQQCQANGSWQSFFVPY